MGQEQRCRHIAGAVHRQRQPRVSGPGRQPVTSTATMPISSAPIPTPAFDRGHQHGRRSERPDGRDGGQQRRRRCRCASSRHPGQEGQLEERWGSPHPRSAPPCPGSVPGTPGSTNIPRPTSPITGSQQYTASGFSSRTRRTVDSTTSATPGRALVAGEHRVDPAERAAVGDALDHLRDHRRVEHDARAMRRSRCGWRNARCSPARPRGRAVAAGTWRPSCRRARRRPTTGWTGSAWQAEPSCAASDATQVAAACPAPPGTVRARMARVRNLDDEQVHPAQLLPPRTTFRPHPAHADRPRDHRAPGPGACPGDPWSTGSTRPSCRRAGCGPPGTSCAAPSPGSARSWTTPTDPLSPRSGWPR